MRPYYLHRRNGVWYAELTDPDTGRKLTARSTGATNRDEALLTIAEWRKTGIPTGRKRKPRPVELAADIENILRAIRKADLFSEDALRITTALKDRGLIDVTVTKPKQGSVLFTEFLETFWDFYASPYVKELKADGQSIHKRHCYEMQSRVRGFYTDYFEGRSLISITKQDIKDFKVYLAQKREKPEGYKGRFAEYLSPAYRNKILICGKTALRWAYHAEIIPVDPVAGIKKVSGEGKKRGILTIEEAAQIFHEVTWKDERARVANWLACLDGLRSGEVLAIRKSDIYDNYIHIRHSWSSMDKLKTTKTNEERKVNLYPEIKPALMKLLADNPHKVDDPFVFFSIYPDQPMDGKILLKGLCEACEAAGIDNKERNICVHSHRHFWAAHMTASMDKDKLMKITGHRTTAIYDEYANHEEARNLEEVAKVGSEVFGKILQFKKGA